MLWAVAFDEMPAVQLNKTMTVTHCLVTSHFSVTPQDGHSSEYRTSANRNLGRRVAFSSKHLPTVGWQHSLGRYGDNVDSGAAGSKFRRSSSFYRSTRRPGPGSQTQVRDTLVALARHKLDAVTVRLSTRHLSVRSCVPSVTASPESLIGFS